MVIPLTGNPQKTQACCCPEHYDIGILGSAAPLHPDLVNNGGEWGDMPFGHKQPLQVGALDPGLKYPQVW